MIQKGPSGGVPKDAMKRMGEAFEKNRIQGGIGLQIRVHANLFPIPI